MDARSSSRRAPTRSTRRSTCSTASSSRAASTSIRRTTAPSVTPATDPAQAHRDAGELALLARALERDLPTLAICRGFQLLNVLRGGDLVQHLPETVGHEGHRETLGVFSEHPVDVKDGTRLAAILGERHDGRAVEPPSGRRPRGGGARRDRVGRGRLARGARGPVRSASPSASSGTRRWRRTSASSRRSSTRRAATARASLTAGESPCARTRRNRPWPSVTPFHSQLPVEDRVRRRRHRGAARRASGARGDGGAGRGRGARRRPRRRRLRARGGRGRGRAARAVRQGARRADLRARGRARRTRSRRRGLDAVVGIGGGSALDVAKAARIAADQGGSTADYADGARTPEPPRIGLVLCPTTAGTGSEVSGASVLTDTERDRKIGFGHPSMRAQHALVDPVLTHGLPPTPTAHSGRRRDGAGDRRVHGGELVASLGRIRARGVPSRRPFAARGDRGRVERRGASQARRRQPDGRARDEPLRLRGRPRARPGARQRQAPAARAHGGARRGRDARALARATAPTGSSASPTRSASPRTGRATARAPCVQCAASSPQRASRRCGTSASPRTTCPRSSRVRRASSRTTSMSTATTGPPAEVEQAFRAGARARDALTLERRRRASTCAAAPGLAVSSATV